jgi:nucleotide-binding universal stress UspA family protein
LARAVLGSVSLKLVKEAPCSVRIARRSNHDGAIRLLVCNDGSPEAEGVVDAVCRRSWPSGTVARIVAVHELLVPVETTNLRMDPDLYGKINEDEHFRLRHIVHQAEERLQQAGLVALPIVTEGDPKDILVGKAKDWKASTIFIGARGLGRIERLLLGSVSSATVAHAPCTVEVVR